MKREPKRLVDGALLETAAAALYLTPGGTYTTISAMTVTNTGGAVVDVTVYLVPQSNTAGAGNAVLWERSVSPGESRIVGEAIAQTMHPGGTIQAKASAAGAVTLVASGYETVP